MSRSLTPLLIVALALGMAACGGDDDSEATKSAERAESAGQAVEAPTEIVGGRTVLKLDRDVEAS